MLTDQNETVEKENRLRALMSEMDLRAVAMSTNANFAWFTCGGSNYVGIASEIGVATAVFTGNAKYIVCDNIEAQRLAEEEITNQGFEFRICQWYETRKTDLIKEIAGGGRLGSDAPLDGAVDVSSQLDGLRRSLTSAEIQRYQTIGRQVSDCLVATARQVERGMTENQVAGILDSHLRSLGIVPILTLIAADERAACYRHPLPTHKPIQRYVMIVTGARKWGLVVSASRIVSFEEVTKDLREKHDAVIRVDAEMIAATRVGTPMNEVLQRGIEAYAKCGFPDEWRLHHQGGPTGYKSRDFRVTLDTDTRISENQAFAWNPSISGTKSEDTIIATAGGSIILSLTEGWPALEVDVNGTKIPRPDIFVR